MWGVLPRVRARSTARRQPRRTQAFKSMGMNMWKRLAVLVGAACIVGSPAATAQQGSLMGTAATAIALYEQSVDACYYEEAIGEAVEKLDALFRQAAPYEWEATTDQAQRSLPMLNNLSAALDVEGAGAQDCSSTGTMIAPGLALAVLALPMTPELNAALKRLSSGGGRAL